MRSTQAQGGASAAKKGAKPASERGRVKSSSERMGERG